MPSEIQIFIILYRYDQGLAYIEWILLLSIHVIWKFLPILYSYLILIILHYYAYPFYNITSKQNFLFCE